jgi:hypothetical protein
MYITAKVQESRKLINGVAHSTMNMLLNTYIIPRKH